MQAVGRLLREAGTAEVRGPSSPGRPGGADRQGALFDTCPGGAGARPSVCAPALPAVPEPHQSLGEQFAVVVLLQQ
jgi:hypothetical protein